MDLQNHGTEDQWERYALGQLSEPELSVLEEHLLVCAACQDRLDEMESFALGMLEAGREAATPSDSRKPLFGFDWSWIRSPAFTVGLACAALILTVAVYFSTRISFAPLAALQLTATRGDMPSSVAAREIHLTLVDAPPAGKPYRVEVVNSTGAAEWEGLTAAGTGSPEGAEVDIHKALGPGDYFVRLYGGNGGLIHEYGFRVRL